MAAGAVAIGIPAVAEAHCDTLDGPVVNAARGALEAKDVNRILIWVQKRDEEKIRKAFDPTLALRKFDPKDVEAGRKYVAAYVEFIHYVERIHLAATRDAEGHFPEAAAASSHRP